MTGLTATKSEKVSVFGVKLEVLRIAAPANKAATNDAEQTVDAISAPASTPTAPAALSPIVFLHEGLGSIAMWRDFPQALCAATGRAGLVYSRRGYGQSDSVPDMRGTVRLKPDYMHQEAWNVLPELLRMQGISQPVLLGHSDGATIALLHAAKFDVEACIAMAPHLFVEDISIAAITQTRDAYRHGNLRQRLTKFHADVDCAFWQWNDIWLSDAFRSFNIQHECKKITCPLLAIQGHDDPYGTMAQIDSLMRVEQDFLSEIGQLPAHNLRRALLKLEQCGHSLHRDQTQKVVSSIRDWLALHCPTP